MDDFALFISLLWTFGVICGWCGRAWWQSRVPASLDFGVTPVTLRAFAAFDDRFGPSNSHRARRHHKP